MFFKKKRVSDKVKEDEELVKRNSCSIDALIIIAEKNVEIVNDLKILQEKLKNLIPSSNSKVFDKDEEIKNKIGDLRIILIKADGEITKKAKEIITDINIAIADRKTDL